MTETDDVKRALDANYIRYHPDAIKVSLVDSDVRIFGIFSAWMHQDNTGEGSQKVITKRYILTIAANDAELFVVTKKTERPNVIVGGREYIVRQIDRPDDGSGNYLATLFLIRR